MAEPKTKRLESLTQKKRNDATEEETEPIDSPSEELAENTATDGFAADRAARAARYISGGAGVNQGDQRAQSAAEFEARAKREAGKMSAAGRAKAEELRKQAKQLRGDE